MKVPALLAVLATSVLVTSAANATKRTFEAKMSWTQENAGTELGEHRPKGTARFTFNDETKELCGELTFSDLTGIATGVHVHQAPAGDPTGDGTVKIEIPPMASPMNFNVKLDASFEKSLNDSELYANIHTAANPKGELRTFSPWDEKQGAQEVPCPPPTAVLGDAGATEPDASASSSSSSSSSSGDSTGSTSTDDDDSESSSGSSATTTPKDAGVTVPAKKDDGGGCSTVAGDSAPPLLMVALGVGFVVVSRKRRRR